MIQVTQRGRDLLLTAPAFPDRALAVLHEELTYYERTCDGSGAYNYEPRQSYAMAGGTVQTLSGYRYRVCRALSSAGIPYQFRPDPYYESDVFEADWAAVAKLYPAYRRWQTECLCRMSAAVGGVVEATTGAGKSYVINALCRLWPRAKTAVVTKRADVFDQLYEGLLNALGPCVGVVTGGRDRPERVTVATADSAHKLPEDLDVVIADEVHEMAAPKYVRQLSRFVRARMFGLTASFERDDGRHHEVEGMFGPIIYRVTPDEAVDARATVPILVEWVRPDVRSDPAWGLPVFERDKFGIWRNEERNRDIGVRVRQLPDDAATVILVKTVEHACFLKKELPDWTMCYAPSDDTNETVATMVRLGVVPADVGRMTPQERRNIKRRFSSGELNRVIATQVWSTGVDFPHLAALVRADAGRSSTMAKQISGRPCRTYKGKQYGLLIDLWDDFNPSFLGRARNRRRVYGELGYTQVGPGHGHVSVGFVTARGLHGESAGAFKAHTAGGPTA